MQTSVVKALFVLFGGACAAASAAASPMTAPAITSADELSCWNGGFPFAVPGGSGARAGPASDAGHGNSLYMVHAGFLDTTDLPGGAATAAPSGGSPGSPHSDLYSDLLQGSDGDKIIDFPPLWRALGRALAQPFSFLGISIRCDSALRTRRTGAGGV